MRHLRRWHLGTPYPQVIEDVRALLARPPLPGAALGLDATGAGRPVAELFRRARPEIPAALATAVITAGRNPSQDESGCWAVPKLALVSTMQALAQGRRFHVAPALPEARVLGKELQALRVKPAPAGPGASETWRERDHDDLVLATCLALWWAERCPGGEIDYAPEPDSLVARMPADVWMEGFNPFA